MPLLKFKPIFSLTQINLLAEVPKSLHQFIEQNRPEPHGDYRL